MAVEREVRTRATADTSDAVRGFELFRSGAVAGTAALVGLAAAVTDFTVKQSEQLDALAKTSKQLGETSDEMQKMQFAAQRSGASTASLERGLRTLNKGLADVSIGAGSTFEKALHSIGLEADDLAGKGGSAKLGTLADALNKIKDPAERSAKAMQLLGTKAGAELKPLLDGGTAGIRALGSELSDMGGIIGGDILANAERLQDELLNTEMVFNAVKAEIANEFIPTIERGTETLRKAAPVIKGVGAEFADNFERAAIAAGLLGEALVGTEQNTESFGRTLVRGAGYIVRYPIAVLSAGTSEAGIAFINARIEAAKLEDGLAALANQAHSVESAVRAMNAQLGGGLARKQVGTVDISGVAGNIQAQQERARARNRPRRASSRGRRSSTPEDIGGEFTGDQEKINEAIAEQAKLNGEAAMSIDNLIDLEQRRAEQAEITSQRVISLQEAEQEAYQAKLQTAVQVGEGIMSVTRGVTDTVVMAAQAQGASAEQVEKIQRKSKGIELAILGAVEVVKAATSFASFNYVEGALHTAAAALAFVQSGIILGGGVPSQAGSGGSSASGGGYVGGPAANGPPPAQTLAETDQPVSPAEISARNQGRQARAGTSADGNVTINFHGTTLMGGDEEKFAEDLDKVLKRGKRKAS